MENKSEELVILGGRVTEAPLYSFVRVLPRSGVRRGKQILSVSKGNPMSHSIMVLPDDSAKPILDAIAGAAKSIRIPSISPTKARSPSSRKTIRMALSWGIS
jgi:hypothetical protein